jgi:Rps23 Pro-64 3,4-dihydroxylase Tpa1-like proline 4-hydroxylase
MKTIPAFYLDHEHMQAVANAHSESFRQAKPFRHVYIDNFLPDEIAHSLADEFPGPMDIPWERGGDRSTLQTRHKLGHSNEQDFPPLIRHMMHEFNSSTFIRFLTTLTGQAGLIVDPHYRGCGLHSTGRGGKLMIHADKSRHPNKKVDQVFNMIYFLNRDWQEDWGGHLELWDKDLTGCQSSIAPVFNRAAFFLTGTNTYHGHPHPLACPEARRRNSLAVYYYLIERPKGENYEGWRNFVDWMPTTEDEKARPTREAQPQLFRFEGKNLDLPPEQKKPE